MFLEGLQSQNFPIMLLFSMKHLYLSTTKIYPDINNFLEFLKADQEVGNSLYFRHNCWNLIMASTKLN